jgi:holin-like protein
MIIRGFAYLISFQFCGELISRFLDVPIPGNVLGMGLLLLGLSLGWVKIGALEEAADLLLSNMALFFIPAGVGVVVYTELIVSEWLPIAVATFLSTFIVMAVTGVVSKKLEPEEEPHVE